MIQDAQLKVRELGKRTMHHAVPLYELLEVIDALALDSRGIRCNVAAAQRRVTAIIEQCGKHLAISYQTLSEVVDALAEDTKGLPVTPQQCPKCKGIVACHTVTCPDFGDGRWINMQFGVYPESGRKVLAFNKYRSIYFNSWDFARQAWADYNGGEYAPPDYWMYLPEPPK